MKKKHYIYQMDMTVLNVIASLIFFVGIFLIIYVVNMTPYHLNFDYKKDYSLLMFLLVPYFMLHEVFHFFGYSFNGADPKKITFGIHLEKGVLCCSCKQTINKRCIMWSLIYPFLFLGVITMIIGFVINSSVLILLSLANMSGAAGDLIMFLNFIKLKDFDFAEYDDPIGFSLYSKNDLSKKKMFGLKYIETKDKLDCHVGKKITVSKKSIYYLTIWYILCLVFCIV